MFYELYRRYLKSTILKIVNDERKQMIISSITQFIRSEIRARESEDVVLGMSGGVDSSVAAWLAAKALGLERVLGLILPDSSVTPKRY